MDVAQFKKQPIMGIVRGVDLEQIEPLVEAVIASGLVTLEIAMNTRDAERVIYWAKKTAQNRLMLGAGTVLDTDSLKTALDSGATFMVMPVFIKDVLEYCLRHKIPVFPGAFTPQEIYNAWRAGATMVKVFPAKFFGPAYFTEIKGPFPDIELLACGGVTAQNIRSFFSSGAQAVAFGASIFRQDWLSAGDFSKIKESIKTLIVNSGFPGNPALK